MILDLGSNFEDGSVTVACTGEKPYFKVSCKIYQLAIKRPSLEAHQKARVELQKELAKLTEPEFREKQRSFCSNLQSGGADLEKNLKSYSPGRAASAQHGYTDMKALCACTTKECFASATLERQAYEQDECTVYGTVFPADFVKVSDRKWVSNNGPEGMCGVVSVFTIEHEKDSDVLWTYTEHFTYTNNRAGLCEHLKDNSATYAWNMGSSIRLRCAELKFMMSPEMQ
jgi:hypothetical protein